MNTAYEKIRLEEEANLRSHLEEEFSAKSITEVLSCKDRSEPDTPTLDLAERVSFPIVEVWSSGEAY